MLPPVTRPLRDLKMLTHRPSCPGAAHSTLVGTNTIFTIEPESASDSPFPNATTGHFARRETPRTQWPPLPGQNIHHHSLLLNPLFWTGQMNI